jgi:hypothetical protein
MTAWPRMMKRKTAAQYCDLSEGAFVREVMAGRLPGAVTFGGREHWDRHAIDSALDAIAGNTAATYEQDFWNRGKAA